MRISERGQVTIPQELRERYGLLANTEVRFVPDDQGVRLIPDTSARANQVEALNGRYPLDRTTDQLMALLRG
jgi:AbrB family looped-hinge helix DNA binding protein